MVKSADDGADDEALFPWDNLDELVRLVALQNGDIWIVWHQGFPTKMIVNHQWIIQFDSNGVKKTMGIENRDAALPDFFVAFFLRELSSWMRLGIGGFGNVILDVKDSRVCKVTFAACFQRDSL